jgi:small subunit ribosomal protein S20
MALGVPVDQQVLSAECFGMSGIRRFASANLPIPALSGKISYSAHVEIPHLRTTASMANHFSALKRTRQTETKTTRNRANKSRLRGALRLLREAITKGDKEGAQSAYRATVSVVDKGVQKGVLHKNTASRYKARLSKRVKAVGAAK